MWGYSIFVYTSHFTFWERSQAWLGFSQRHMKNVKGLEPFPNLSLTNSNLETASYLTVLKGCAVMLVLNTTHFSFQVLLVLQFGALWVPWRSLFRREKDSLRELLLHWQHCLCKYKSETEAHACTPSHKILRHFELYPCIIIAFLLVQLVWLKKSPSISLWSLHPSIFHWY